MTNADEITDIMLEYTKTILQKVSFSPFLFGKELKKSIKWLKNEEVLALKAWCIITFGDLYPETIREVFQGVRI